MGLLHEHETVRAHAGLWRRMDHTILRFTGRDAAAWLQNQTTNDLLRLEDGEGNLHALLDRQGRVQAFFTLHRFEDEFWAVIAREQKDAVFQRMETHLFLEHVEVEDVGRGGAQLCVEGPRSLIFLAHQADESPEEAAAVLPTTPYAYTPMVIAGFQTLVFRMAESGEDGFLLVPAPEEAGALYNELEARAIEQGVAIVSKETRNVLRIEGGTPRYGIDIGPERIVAETPLVAEAVSYDKGCYLGQEVVARLKAYGSPKYALVGIEATDAGALLPEPGTDLYAAGKRVGQLCSHTFSPTFNKHIAMAYLGRNVRTPGCVRTLTGSRGGHAFDVEVCALPFAAPPDRDTLAHQYYDEALARFEQDTDDVDESAIELLRDAVLLSPRFEDAYEAIGVILHRHHRVDEAIGYMQVLARLNPNSVMAHTNLSVFYVAKGMNQEAEDEKAIAKELETMAEFVAHTAKQTAEQERARLRAEAENHIEMFQEVLDIDPEDPVATMGLASAYIQLDRHAEAVPCLETATHTQKDYSAAFLKLGQCHEILGNRESAKEAYRKGIETASRKGDLMPLRDMERRLKALA